MTLPVALTLTPSLAQVSQIFFNCLVTELFVAATFNDTSTTTPPICVRNMSHPRWAYLLANDTNGTNATDDGGIEGRMLGVKVAGEKGPDMTCLLYTSDAADE